MVSILSPAAGAQLIRAGLKSYIRKKNFEKDRFLRDLKNLQKRELINYHQLADGQVEITITKNGKKQMLKYQLDDIQLKKPRRWDGKWRLIIFDIPHSYKPARDALRRKLLTLEFYPLQKSVFITPYPYENEIDFICSIFDIRKYVLVLYVNYFEGAEKLKHHFGL